MQEPFNDKFCAVIGYNRAHPGTTGAKLGSVQVRFVRASYDARKGLGDNNPDSYKYCTVVV